MEVPSQSELNVADDHAAIAEHRAQVKIPETLLSQFRSLRGTNLFPSSLSTALPSLCLSSLPCAQLVALRVRDLGTR